MRDQAFGGVVDDKRCGSRKLHRYHNLAWTRRQSVHLHSDSADWIPVQKIFLRRQQETEFLERSC
jgi:hypothetical protein